MGLLIVIAAIALGLSDLNRIRAALGIAILAALGMGDAAMAGNLSLDAGTIAYGAVLYILGVLLFFWIGRAIRSYRRRKLPS